jgi:K+-sensing histidine kinase KdpD
MRLDQTPENPQSDSAESKTGVAKLLLSIKCKLDELTSSNQTLFRMIDSPTQKGLSEDQSVTDGFPLAAISEDERTEPALAYRLSSLVDFMRQRYGFEECAVFLLKADDSKPEKLVSSGSREEDQGSKEFEDEVGALWERGDVTRAVGEKRRLSVPSSSGGSLLIIPFKILGREDGFWVARFREESFCQKESSVELPFWTELISACIENARLKELPAQGEGPHCIESEKLFTTAEISRAVVHEINNCLQVILGRTQLLLMNERQTQKTPSGLKVLETMETNANRICSILKDFSDHLHRQSGRSSGEGEVNVQRILESNLIFLQYILKGDKIKLQFDLGENLPPACGDPGELELVLLSLIWGLRDQLRAKGSIRVQGSTEGNSLCLRIPCASRESRGDKHPDFADLESSRRFRLASEILKRHQGELKFERAGEREIHLSLTFPTSVKRKANPERPREPELSSPV